MALLVYPPDGHVTSSETIFFIGSAENHCAINGKLVELFENGNFCPIVDLNPGENDFLVEVDGKTLNLKITREELENKKAIHWFESQVLKYNYRDGFKKLCLDPGHGGSQRGTCSPKGVAEKDLNLKLAKLIKQNFVGSNIEVFTTRESDDEITLAERVLIAKNNDCDLFISVHHNAIPDDQDPLEHQGISVHYYYEHSKELAEKLAEEISLATGLLNRGIIRQDLHVLRENPQRISVLVEFGFLIHPLESEIICSQSFQENAAKAVFEAVLDYKS